MSRWEQRAGTVAWLDQEDARTAEVVARHGWLVTHVGTCGCDRCDAEGARRARTGPATTEPGAFTYTTGLTGLGHPELLVRGLSARVAHGVLQTVGARVARGLVLRSGDAVDLPGWPHRVVADRMTDPGRYVLAANRFYGRPARRSVPAVELVGAHGDRWG
ncbi:hypothetical protein GCM10027047_06150 [Rhodococcus aerolatus]